MSVHAGTLRQLNLMMMTMMMLLQAEPWAMGIVWHLAVLDHYRFYQYL